MKITLKDGSVKEYASPMSIIDIAKDISEGLARVACLGEVDGEEEDLRTVIDHDCQLNILTAKDEKGLAALRHTASHVMAQAIKRLYPEAKLAIGTELLSVTALQQHLHHFSAALQTQHTVKTQAFSLLREFTTRE